MSLFSFLTPVKWAYHIDDLMLTYEDLPLLQETLQARQKSLENGGWVKASKKI